MHEESKEVIAEVASMYYEQDKSQEEIGEILFFSRSKVSRLLKKAIEMEIVSVTVNYPIQVMASLGKSLSECYPLKEVVVLRNRFDTMPTMRKLIGQAAARFIDAHLSAKDVLGLSWGKTMREVVRQLTPRDFKDITVVSMVGTATVKGSSVDSNELVKKAAAKYQARFVQMKPPLYTCNPEQTALLLADPDVQKAMTAYRSCNMAVTGIGSVESICAQYFDDPSLVEEESDRLKALGAIGSICGRLFDRNGREVNSQLKNRTMGIGIDELKRIPTVILTISDPEKTDAIYSAITSGLVNVLITDDKTAIELIKYKISMS